MMPLRRKFAKITVTIERREDGGVRVYSEDVPGFYLSHKNAVAVLEDVPAALEIMLSGMWGVQVKASPLAHLDGSPVVSNSEAIPSLDVIRPTVEQRYEYVAEAC